MKPPRAILAAALSAALFTLGLPNELFSHGQPIFGYVALVPLYLALASSPSWGSAALVTAIYGAIHHASSSYWLYFYKDFAIYTIGATTLAYAAVYAVFGLYLRLLLRGGGWARPLAFALVWTAFEFQKSTGFLGYPWGLLPYTQTRFLPLLQIADTTGVYGLSFFLALANASLAEFLAMGPVTLPPPRAPGRGARRGFALASLALAAILLGYGALRLAFPRPASGSFSALIVQQDIDPWRSGEEASILANTSTARRFLAEMDTKPELILFSESSLSRPFEEFRSWYERHPAADPLLPFIRESGTWLFTGAPVVLDWEDFSATNSVILVDPRGTLAGDYAKTHPVPFAEAIPFWEYEWFRTFMRNTVGLESGWTMGDEYVLFELPTRAGTLRFGAPICFEDAFAGLCRDFSRLGADLLVNLTNDSWSNQASAEIQHFAAARFRSIELRKSLLRSTNGGVSCVVDARGKVIAELPLFERTAAAVDVPLYRGNPATVYELVGDAFAILCLLLSAAWSLILMIGIPGKRRAAA